MVKKSFKLPMKSKFLIKLVEGRFEIEYFILSRRKKQIKVNSLSESLAIFIHRNIMCSLLGNIY